VRQLHGLRLQAARIGALVLGRWTGSRSRRCQTQREPHLGALPGRRLSPCDARAELRARSQVHAASSRISAS
jgi:hypothetical protein